MSLITYIATALLVVGLVTFVLALILDKDKDTEVGAFFGIGGLVLAIAGLFTFLLWGGMNIGYRVSANECERFAEQAEVDTKMVRYNSGSFECLVRSDSGWVVKGNYWNSEVGR